MHFNIYVNDDVGKRLSELARQSGKTRNAVIREAIELWIVRNRCSGWPAAVLEFEGVPDAPYFEAYRDELGQPSVDPLS
ncbi:MAG: ribbon-helix-helix domain-containing protein [Chromatiaceae bacterium]